MRRGLGRPEAIVPGLVWIFEPDTRAVSHRLDFIEPRLITDEVMMMMVVVHASHHFGRLHRRVLAFSALPFGCAARMHRAVMHRAAIGPDGGAARTRGCAAPTTEASAEMPRASTTPADMSAT